MSEEEHMEPENGKDGQEVEFSPSLFDGLTPKDHYYLWFVVGVSFASALDRFTPASPNARKAIFEWLRTDISRFFLQEPDHPVNQTLLKVSQELLDYMETALDIQGRDHV